LFIIISSLERLFLGIRPYWGTGSGSFYYTALGPRPRHLLWTFLLMLLGRKSRFAETRHGYFSQKVDKVRLNLNSGFTLDGEIYATDPQDGDVLASFGGKASFLQLDPKLDP
jgi:diacylglycerol kinase (ATP)